LKAVQTSDRLLALIPREPLKGARDISGVEGARLLPQRS